jgi:hypothetical protein
VQHIEPVSGPPDDVAAAAAGIDAAGELAGTARQPIVRLEQKMPTTTPGAVRPCEWKARAVHVVPPLRLNVLQVQVKHAELDAGRHTNQSVRPLREPTLHDVGVCSRVQEAIGGERRLVVRAARKDRQALAGEVHRSCEVIHDEYPRSVMACGAPNLRKTPSMKAVSRMLNHWQKVSHL